MVARPRPAPQAREVKKEEAPPFKWTSATIEEIIENEYRLEGGVYSTEGRQAREVLKTCKWPIVNLCGDGGLATAYHRPRFKRIYVEQSDYPIFQPAQVNELLPKPSAYISDLTRTDIDALRVKKGQVLLTCSGTIGNCAYVRNTLNNQIFSHDLIRIEPTEYNGFLYAYMRSKIGSTIITTNNYGAVIKHIEPNHLDNVPVPNPPPILKMEIHGLIEDSFRLRDESNDLMDEAQALLKEALKLPDLDELKAQARLFDENAGFDGYSVPLRQLDNRLDASYHVPIVAVIEKRVRKTAREVTRVGDGRISQSVILPGRFKRVYVEEGNGVVFFSGKNILELDPADKKYLSFSQHNRKIKSELTIRENMILITPSGTIGKTAFVPKHWDGWAMTHDIIRIVPTSNEISGYLYAWLSSPYAFRLISRFTYGAVVGHIEKEHILKVSVPLLSDENTQREINDKVLEANRTRAKAYELERKALDILDRKVIHAR